MGGTGTAARRVLVALLAITAAVAVLGAFQRPGAARTTRPGATLGTPIWSTRRIPQPVVDAVGAQHLQAALVDRLGSFQGCFSVHDEIAPAATLNIHEPQTPASTIKLLTATAALHTLGAAFHFTTAVVAPSAPSAGAVDRLIMIGGGDPLLATPERIALDAADPDTAGLAATPLATLADRIVAAGIRSVPGGVVGTDDRYDSARDVPAWNESRRASVGPIGALTVNDGYGGASGTGSAAADPALNAATELTRLLSARGVSVGPPRRGVGREAEQQTKIASLDSPPLPLVLAEMLSASDNLTAEMLMRELGARAGEGTTARGVLELTAALTDLGVNLTGVSIVDGSGLSRDNSVTCTTLIDVLNLAETIEFAPIRHGLAIAGERGTLAARLRSPPLAGNLRAKTGTLDGVSGLAGFVHSDRPLTFSLLVAGPFGESTAFSLREAMATHIAVFPESSAGLTLVPAPIAPLSSTACPDARPAC